MDILTYIKNYQDTLRTKLAALLQVAENNIAVTWDAVAPTAAISASRNGTIVNYTFTYRPNDNHNLIFSGSSVVLNMNNGFQLAVQPTGIDLNTLELVRQEFIAAEKCNAPAEADNAN